jgi:transcriptional regulator with XRE-family HTH domain
MLNTSDFLYRLQELMSQKQLSASAFATRIGVQRSSVSHILAQRNKPSLEFILKIHEAFDDVDLSWLLLGEKKVPTQNVREPSPLPDPIKPEAKPSTDLAPSPKDSFEPQEIEAIITLYKDGSFKKYSPNS